ncbi:MAG: hypothetical protein WC310_04940 [Patescibacteria group bacterium]|jgi:hypothetical protein
MNIAEKFKTEIPAGEKQPLEERLRQWISNTDPEEAKKILEDFGREYPEISIKDLEICRIWAWQRLGLEQYTPEIILQLYEIIQDNPDIALGPTSFRFCDSIEKILHQIDLTKKILGDNSEKFYQGEPTTIEIIDDYEIKIHSHDCPYGIGLICFSMWNDDNKLFQISFYPSSPIVLYEMKGAASPKNEKEARDRKRVVHKFESKYGLSILGKLTATFLKTADTYDEEARVISGLSLWRNFGVSDKKIEQIDRLHQKTMTELGVKHPPEIQSVIGSINRLAREIRKSPFHQGSPKFDQLVDFVIKEEYAKNGNGQRWEDFAAKLLFSRHIEDRVYTINQLRFYFLQRYPEIYQNQPDKAALDFHPPAFYEIDKRKIKQIIGKN